MENSGLDFDKIVQDKLDNLSEAYTSEAWHLMSSSLDTLLPRSEDQIFDSILRNKIAGVENKIVGDWPSVHEDLDKLKSISDQKRFDKIIQNKVGYLNHSRGANWTKLRDQMDEWDQFRTQIISTRIVEVFVVILLFIVSYGAFKSDKPSNQLKEKPSIAQVDNTTVTNQSLNRVTNIIDNRSEIVSDLKKKLDKTPQASLKIANGPIHSHSATKNNLTQFGGVNTATLSLSADVINDSHESNASAEVRQMNVSTLNTDRALNSTPITVDLRTKNSINTLVQDKKELTSLERKLNLLLSDKVLSVKEIVPAINLLKKQSFKDGWSTALAVTLDEHFITTPYDEDFKLNALERFSRGYGGSIRFNKKFGKWNIETGVGYHYIDYTPKEFFVIDGGSFNSGYQLVKHSKTELQFVEIPLEFQHNIFTGNKLRFYANVGASANVNIASKYTFQRFNDNKNSTAPKPVNPRILTSAPQALSNEKEYSSGALEGGSISDNSYFTANIGIGIDYHISDGMDLFLQTTYHNRIGRSEIGPNDDLFHLTSFNFGARLPMTK